MSRFRGAGFLLLTTLLWGSSFPAIKVVMASLDEFTYTWLRGAIALTAMAPIVIYYHLRDGLRKSEVVGGLITGIAYTLGLWLQGWGTKYTTASNSAFITGLNVVFVHTYDAVIGRSYPPKAAASLIISITGLYVLTRPGGGIGLGELLVLASAFFWAAQVILVDKFSRSNPITFTFYEITPSFAFIPIATLTERVNQEPIISTIPILLYLGIACTVLAFMSQVYGQRWLRPYEAALIILLEPIFASIFAAVTLKETFDPQWMVGATLIIAGMIIAILPKK